MKTARSCMLFGSAHALSGIKDAVILFHSVIGCNFGTMGPHLLCDMSDIHQTCTVVSDREVVFGGEGQVRKAIRFARELYSPSAVFVVLGCIPEIIKDDIDLVCSSEDSPECPVIYIPSPGFLKNEYEGFDDCLMRLLPLVGKKDKGTVPSVNIIGPSGDDPRMESELEGPDRLPGLHSFL